MIADASSSMSPFSLVKSYACEQWCGGDAVTVSLSGLWARERESTVKGLLLYVLKFLAPAVRHLKYFFLFAPLPLTIRVEKSRHTNSPNWLPLHSSKVRRRSHSTYIRAQHLPFFCPITCFDGLFRWISIECCLQFTLFLSHVLW